MRIVIQRRVQEIYDVDPETARRLIAASRRGGTDDLAEISRWRIEHHGLGVLDHDSLTVREARR